MLSSKASIHWLEFITAFFTDIHSGWIMNILYIFYMHTIQLNLMFIFSFNCHMSKFTNVTKPDV